jgi:hypothetical protein
MSVAICSPQIWQAWRGLPFVSVRKKTKGLNNSPHWSVPMRTKPFVFVLLFLVLLTTFFYTSALAQSIFGTILGTVTDPSGAVLQGVTVTVTNQGENISRDVKTDDH